MKQVWLFVLHKYRIILFIVLFAAIMHLARTTFAFPISDAQTLRWGITNPTACTDSIDWNSGVADWRDVMDDHNVNLGDDDITIHWNEITDADFGGEDHINQNVDSRDITLVASHGTALVWYNYPACTQTKNCYPTRWGIYLTRDTGSPTGCGARTTHMLLGDNDLEFIDWAACNSSDTGWATSLITFTDGLHQWHGYHGTTSSGARAYLGNYADDAFDGPAAAAWVDNMTDIDYYSSTKKDICGTALTFGNNANDAINRRNNERYGVSDYGDPSPGGWAWRYIFCCDPPHPNNRAIQPGYDPC